MKRSVAVYGKTPQFVRWALEHPCDLRDLQVDNLPDRTFRQLRNIRELSVARSAGRIIEGVCLRNPQTKKTSEALGFIAEEIYDFVGSAEELQRTCGDCPANTLSRHDTWAGCYGWMAADPDFSFEDPHGLDYVPDESLLKSFSQVIDKQGFESQISNLFPAVTKPHWYTLWQVPTPNVDQLGLLLKILSEVRSLDGPLNDSALSLNSVDQLRQAVTRALEHQLKLHVELVPPGYSDGLTWTLKDHCPLCKCSEPVRTKSRRHCEACRRFGHFLDGRKSKVLGVRPYMKLVGILGAERTKELLAKHQSS